MKKFILIAALGLMYSSVHAFDLPDNIQVVQEFNTKLVYEPVPVQEFVYEISITADASQVLAFQTDISKKETFIQYDASVVLNDICLFYRPVIYEASYLWSTNLIYDEFNPGTNKIVKNIPNSNIQTPDKIPRK